MTRQTKTPKQRAEEALAVAERKADRLIAEALHLEAQLAVVSKAQAEAIAIRDYCRQHPALQTTSTATTTQEEGNA